MLTRRCSDTCPNCLYICEGDFICTLANELVVVDWIPVHDKCIKNKKSLLICKKSKRGSI